MIHIKEDVTVVVPCYNVESYLPRCIDSLLEQTFENVEILMVEDCSTDGTRKVVREYEQKYQNCRAIYNEKNGGLGNARNVGIVATTTKYIAFLDSDDWLPQNYLSEMYKTLIENKADLSVCDVFLCYDDSEKDQRIISYIKKPDKYGLINTPLAATSSAKFFKTSLFKNLHYPTNMVNEDIPVTLAILSRSKVAYTDKTFFCYYQRPGSIQNGRVTTKRLDVFRALELLKKNTAGEIDAKIWDAVVWHQVFAVYLYVLPKAKMIHGRRELIRGFRHRAIEGKIQLTESNPGFVEFLKSSKFNRFYGERAIKYFKNDQYVRSDILMSLYQFLQNHINGVRTTIWLARLIKFSLLHPIQFAKKVSTRNRNAKQKYVIKTNTSLEDVVVAAKKQAKLKMKSSVSVIVPNYNYERFLLQRVYSILYQTRKIGEIIILDDNSSDNSVKLAKEIKSAIDQYIPVRLINNTQNRGTFSQWERGFTQSEYDYVWIAEADDYCSKDFLCTALVPLEKDKEVVISYVNTGYVDKNGAFMGDVTNDIDYQGSGHWQRAYVNNGMAEAKQYCYLNNTIANVSSVVFRKLPGDSYRSYFEEARNYRQAGDWTFYVNYMMHGSVAYSNQIHNFYRMHGENVSSTTKAQDHIDEILKIQKSFVKKLSLDKTQQLKMQQRIKFLKKAWKI